MTLQELSSLLDEVMKCPVKNSASIDNIFISVSKPYDPEGWGLFIGKNLVDYNTACCLAEIVKEHKLELDNDESKEDYYIIFSKKSW